MHNAAYISLWWQILSLVKTADSSSGLGSVVLWLSKEEFFTKDRLPVNMVFQWRLSSIDGRVPRKVIFHSRASSTEGCLPLKVILHQRSSCTKGSFPLKVVFHQILSSTEGCLPPKVFFHLRSSSTHGCLPLKVVFHIPWHLGWSYICENSQHTKSQPPTLPRSGLNLFWTKRN